MIEISTEESKILDEIEEIGKKQFVHLDGLEVTKYNKLFDRLIQLVVELKNRPGDRRVILKNHYRHPNLQVWLNAATHTLAVAPEDARAELKAIEETNRHPQAMDAGMRLHNLETGFFKPT
ncbi:MAG: DUF2019 domain-containing protein [Alsobacter sp.]